MIDKGANVSHEDNKHNTPYILARRNAKHAILKMLVDNGAKAYIDEAPRLPLKQPPTTKKASAPSKPSALSIKQGKDSSFTHSLSAEKNLGSSTSNTVIPVPNSSDKKLSQSVDQNS